ncbi:MAG: FAD-linked oxidase C-terminal domain-containing protein [Planctomycetota bacterium]
MTVLDLPAASADPPENPNTLDITGFLSALRSAVRGEVMDSPQMRGIYATDASHYQITPAAVFVPEDEADVLAGLRVCHEFKVPVTPRGGATSLSGQTFGAGLVIDVSKHLDQVLEVNEEEGWARVQPGVVRDRLNAQLKPLGLHFAPDPATGNRATVGGMVGNNTSGTRSIAYGKTVDHVFACRVALPDGTVLDAGPCDDATWQARSRGEGVPGGKDGPVAAVYRGVKQIVQANQDEILARYPKVMRRVSGYNLDEFVDGAGYVGTIGPRGEYNAGPRTWNLSNLIVGSEGTLGLLLEAKIRLTPLPGATAVCVVHFEDDIDALRRVPEINEFGPSAVELLDRHTTREAKVNGATRDMAWWIEGDPDAVLLCEFFGDTPEDVERKANDFAETMKQRGIGYAHPVMLTAEQQADIWNTRKLGLGLISNVKGPVKGQAFVEDACVPIETLAEYIDKLREKCHELEIDTSMYAHASVGVIHFRPAVDLHRDDHRTKMKQIADYAFDMVVERGGVFAGEHGDGMVRGEFIPRFFGDRLYEAFRQLKRVFDPHNLMNPGKLVDAPSMTDPTILRYGEKYRVAEVPSHYHYRDQGGFRLAVEQCNGVGACRKLGSGTMCPSYMATKDEKDTTRARANALRLAMSGQLGDANDVKTAIGGDEVDEVLDLCLACKACKSECPNAVDMAKLKSDTLQMRHDRKGTPLGYKLIGRMPDVAPWMAGPWAKLAAALDRFPPYRALFEKLTGIDRRRPLPPFATRSLQKLLADRGPSKRTPTRGKVALFNDTYASYMEPHVGLAAYDLLEGCGYEVVLADAGCCQRPRLSKGLLREAKPKGQRTLENLDEFAAQGIPIVCLEPSCASALKDDLPDLIDDEALGRRVSEHVHMIDVFLEAQGIELTSEHQEILLHGHCHQKAMFGTSAIKRSFAAMPETVCEEVDSGCCGMAGSFGYEHYAISEKVGQDRLFPAVREAVNDGKTVVACGISCRHQLHDFLGVDAKHWVEVVKPAASTPDPKA